jgi:hypothetical protein
VVAEPGAASRLVPDASRLQRNRSTVATPCWFCIDAVPLSAGHAGPNLVQMETTEIRLCGLAQSVTARRWQGVRADSANESRGTSYGGLRRNSALRWSGSWGSPQRGSVPFPRQTLRLGTENACKNTVALGTCQIKNEKRAKKKYPRKSRIKLARTAHLFQPYGSHKDY